MANIDAESLKSLVGKLSKLLKIRALPTSMKRCRSVEETNAVPGPR
ncbi:MAG: hypothetical protein GKS00_22560 [Alphaproteobacteria bacterium]|nr:hypothetical protein [Alphaproteobacteria bacterium]